MIIYKCDRCKKEEKNSFDLVSVSVGTFIPKKYELCDGCAKDLQHFLRPEQSEV